MNKGLLLVLIVPTSPLIDSSDCLYLSSVCIVSPPPELDLPSGYVDI